MPFPIPGYRNSAVTWLAKNTRVYFLKISLSFCAVSLTISRPSLHWSTKQGSTSTDSFSMFYFEFNGFNLRNFQKSFHDGLSLKRSWGYPSQTVKFLKPFFSILGVHNLILDIWPAPQVAEHWLQAAKSPQPGSDGASGSGGTPSGGILVLDEFEKVIWKHFGLGVVTKWRMSPSTCSQVTFSWYQPGISSEEEQATTIPQMINPSTVAPNTEKMIKGNQRSN